MRLVRYIRFVIAGLSGAALLFCTGDYNPFGDSTNARMHVLASKSGFASGDSVPLYTTRKLVLAATVAEQIDSFSVSAANNRYWSDTCVHTVSGNEYVFTLSFHDTGWTSITIMSWRTTGDRTSEVLQIHVWSPLRQNDIDTTLDARVLLSTPGVGDTVWYHWSYRDILGDTVHSPSRELTKQFDVAGEFAGRLWVSLDTAGMVMPSPASAFTMRLSDATGPYVVCLNDSVKGDTVFTGDDVFAFEVYVTDASGLKWVSADGGPFDYANPPRYTLTIHDMTAHSRSSPRVVDVLAVDRSDNATERRFWLVYDPGAPGSQGTVILVEGVRDTVVTNRTDYIVVGTVRDYTHSVIDLTAALNGTPVGGTQEITISDGIGYWGVRLSLEPGYNILTIVVSDTLGRELAQRAVGIIRDPSAVDTAGPLFVDVKINDTNAPENQSVFVRDSTGELHVVAFDPSGIAAVTVNGSAVVSENGYRWITQVRSIGHAWPLPVTVTARDNAGNLSVYQFLVRRNLLPAMAPDWTWPQRFFANTSYEYLLRVVDDDENVSLTMTNRPAEMTVERAAGINNWRLRWRPAEKDAGAHVVTVTLNDGLEETVIRWPFFVAGDSTGLVSFATRAADLPRYLEADHDTLALLLALAPDKGTAPFRYRVWLDGAGGMLFDTASAARSVPFSWAPAAADVGARRLTITVRDAQEDGDTLYREIEIVPRNHDSCSLRLDIPDGTPFSAYGEIDMREASAPVVLTLVIIDDDHPYTEQYVVVTERDGMTAVDTLDSARGFTVVVDTIGRRAHDTLRVWVSDRTGGRDSVFVPVVYSFDGPRPAAGWIWPARFVAGVSFSLPFAIEENEHEVTLDVTGAPAGLVFTPAPPGNRWILSYAPSTAQAGSHTVQVVLSDGYQDTTILWRFDVLADSSMLIRFTTVPGGFPSYAEAGKPLSVWLEAEGGTVPYRYAVRYSDRPSFLLDTVAVSGGSALLTLTPSAADTGMRHLVAVVADGYGDADTLHRDLLVVPANEFPCSLSVILPAGVALTGSGEIDMSGSDGPDTAWFTIHDRDHPATEEYRVLVTSRNVTTIRTLDSAGAFYVVIDTTTGRRRDTIRVIVEDQTVSADTVILYVYYGPGGLFRTIHVNTTSSGANVTADVARFPLLVRLDSGNFDFSGFDETEPGLIFMRGQNELPHEIESWSASGQAAAVWVLVDTIFGNRAQQAIEIFVQNGPSQSNPSAVFRAADGFAGVWHMNDNASNTHVADATGNNHGIMNANTANSHVQGMISGALDFNLGFNEYVNCGSAPEFDNMTTQTWSAWIMPRNFGEEGGRILDKSPNIYQGDAFTMNPVVSGGAIRFYASFGGGTFLRHSVDGASPHGEWTLVAMTWTGSSNASTCRLYCNGVEVAYLRSESSSGTRYDNAAYNLRIGNRSNAVDRDFDGIIDEVRVETVVRSPAWIKLSYETQRPDGTAVTIE